MYVSQNVKPAVTYQVCQPESESGQNRTPYVSCGKYHRQRWWEHQTPATDLFLNNNNIISIAPISSGIPAQRHNKSESLSMISQTGMHKSAHQSEGPPKI